MIHLFCIEGHHNPSPLVPLEATISHFHRPWLLLEVCSGPVWPPIASRGLEF